MHGFWMLLTLSNTLPMTWPLVVHKKGQIFLLVYIMHGEHNYWWIMSRLQDDIPNCQDCSRLKCMLFFFFGTVKKTKIGFIRHSFTTKCGRLNSNLSKDSDSDKTKRSEWYDLYKWNKAFWFYSCLLPHVCIYLKATKQGTLKSHIIISIQIT